MKKVKFSFAIIALLIPVFFISSCMQQDKSKDYTTLSSSVEILSLPEQESGSLPYDFQEGISIFKKDGLYGYIDKQGNIVMKEAFDDALSFSEGLAAVKKNGLWGYIDHSGKEVIPIKFDSASLFTEDVASVKIGEKWFLIDKNGNQLKDFDYSLTGQGNPIYFWSGYTMYQKDGRCGYVDRKGKLAIPAQYDQAGSVANGLAFVKLDKTLLCIDKNGKNAFPDWKIVSHSPQFQNGLAMLTIATENSDNETIVVDVMGTKVFQFPEEIGEPIEFNEGLIFYKDATTEKKGAIDLTGKVVIPPVLDKIGHSLNGVIDVYIGNDTPIYIINPVFQEDA